MTASLAVLLHILSIEVSCSLGHILCKRGLVGTSAIQSDQQINLHYFQLHHVFIYRYSIILVCAREGSEFIQTHYYMYIFFNFEKNLIYNTKIILM